jgi:hypothetical protein
MRCGEGQRALSAQFSIRTTPSTTYQGQGAAQMLMRRLEMISMQQLESYRHIGVHTETKETVVEVGLCDPCHALAICRPRSDPHKALQFLGSIPTHINPILAREAGGHIDQYRCTTCGTNWHHRIDRHDVGRGFRLAPG